MSRWLALLSLLAALAWAAPAAAKGKEGKDAKDGKEAKAGEAESVRLQADTLFQEGQSLFQAGRYDEAIAALLEAQRLAPSPALLFNIAQAYRLNNDCKDAHAYYRDFLAASPNHPNHAFIERRILEMENCVQKARKPPPVVIARPPPPPSTAPARADAHPGRSKRIVGIVTSSVGLGLIGGGIALRIQAEAARQDVADLYAQGGVWTPAYEELERRAVRRDRQAIGLFAAGGAALIGGALVYYLGWRDTQTIEVTPVAGGAATTLLCRF